MSCHSYARPFLPRALRVTRLTPLIARRVETKADCFNEGLVDCELTGSRILFNKVAIEVASELNCGSASDWAMVAHAALAQLSKMNLELAAVDLVNCFVDSLSNHFMMAFDIVEPCTDSRLTNTLMTACLEG